jgi:coatomer protein complex subunit alpha (xenin)
MQTGDNGIYELITLPKEPNTSDNVFAASGGKPGTGMAAIFVARNRLAVLDKATQNIEIKDLANTVTKTIKCPVQTNEIFYGGTASLLLSAPAAVVLFDIQQQKTLAEIATPAVKYVVWSTDGNMVALLSKHSKCS